MALPSSAEEVRAYVQQVATEARIDPRVPDLIVRSEGGYDPNGRGWIAGGDAGMSWGPFQDYFGGGLGNSMLRDGIDAHDREQWRENVAWNIGYIANHYNLASLQSQWHGVRDNPTFATQFAALFGEGGGTGGDGTISLPIVGSVSGGAVAVVVGAALLALMLAARR